MPKNNKQKALNPLDVVSSIARAGLGLESKAEKIVDKAINRIVDNVLPSKGKTASRTKPKPKPRNMLAMNSVPMAMQSSSSLSRPRKQTSHGRKSDVIEETEYILDVSPTSTSFQVVNQFALNPAQAGTFPWASSIAKQYEKWYCEYVEFCYKPTVSQYASLGQTGKVILAFDYDASDSPPSTKQQTEDIQEHVDGLPFEYLCLRLQPDMLHEKKNGKYNRAGPLPGGSDIKSFDGGNLYVSTSGLTGTGIIGELHVKYRFRMLEPILSASSNAAPVNNQVAQFSSVSTQESLTTVTLTQLALATTVTNGISAVNSSGSIALQPGNYLITASVDITSTAAITSMYFTIRQTVAGTTTTIYPGNSANYEPELTAASGANIEGALLNQTWYYSCNAANTSISLWAYASSSGTILALGSLVFLAV